MNDVEGPIPPPILGKRGSSDDLSTDNTIKRTKVVEIPSDLIQRFDCADGMDIDETAMETLMDDESIWVPDAGRMDLSHPVPDLSSIGMSNLKDYDNSNYIPANISIDLYSNSQAVSYSAENICIPPLCALPQDLTIRLRPQLSLGSLASVDSDSSTPTTPIDTPMTEDQPTFHTKTNSFGSCFIATGQFLGHMS